ncbi:MAG TPA: glycine zipper family protein [Opitutaceae bacterium]
MNTKTVASALVLALATAIPLQAQLFRPEVVSGAVLGGVAGAVIGHNDGRHGREGAAYGVAAGALLGAMVGASRDHADYRGTQVPVAEYPSRYYTGGYRHGHGYPGYRGLGYGYHYRPYGQAGYGYYDYRVSPSYRYGVYTRYDYDRYERPSYTATGTLLGGIAGAIIGHNDGRHGWEGAAYGAGAGYLLGRIADARAERNRREAEAVLQARAQVRVENAMTAASRQQPVIINNYYYGNTAPATAMSSANNMFGR